MCKKAVSYMFVHLSIKRRSLSVGEWNIYDVSCCTEINIIVCNGAVRLLC